MTATKWIQCLLYVLVIALVAFVVKDHFASFTQIFSQVNWWIIGLLVFLHTPAIALGGWIFARLSATFGYQLNTRDWFGLSFVANFINQILPYRPGVVFRYVYLHKHYQMPLNQYSIIMTMYFLLLVITGAVFTLLGYRLDNLPNVFHQWPWIAGSIISLILLFLMLTHLGREQLPTQARNSLPAQRVRSFVHNCFYSLNVMISKPVHLLEAMLYFLLYNLINACIFYAIFMAMANPLPLLTCVFLAGVMVVAQVFPITPGNIGVLETLFGMLTQMLFHDFSLGFGAVALYRASLLIPSFILGALYSFLFAGTFLPKFNHNSLG